MPRQEYVPNTYELSHSVAPVSESSVYLQSSYNQSPINFSFEAIKPGLFRTTFASKTHPLPPFPSATRPATHSNAFKVVERNGTSKAFHCGNIEAVVEWTGVPTISFGFHGEEPLQTDLPYRSYVIDGPGTSHYTRYHCGSLHVGLGEKAAPLDLSNRNFTLSATDCFGYDVYRTDPMYKHIPLLIRATPKGVVATFSTSHTRGYYSIGSEMDGLWGPFKVYRQDYGGLEIFTMIGRTIQDVVRLYADLVGYPLLVPRWAFGHLAGGTKYSMPDRPRASEALMEFVQKLENYDIPCNGLQMGSRYNAAATESKMENVFTWNRHRFSDPEAFCDAFHRRGIKLIADMCPFIPTSHPQYEDLVAQGALFTDPHTSKIGKARLWSADGGKNGEGGHIDFSSTAGYDFWYDDVKSLRKIGVDCMLNNHNEYTIQDDRWMLSLSHSRIQEALGTCGEERKDIGLWGRAMHCELMAKCSHDALAEVVPHERPFVLTRSATAGTMRYAASSWSGDKVTSWEGMRGANALSLMASMCLLQNYGHNIGGSGRPQPSPELLLRWIQLGIHSPRFSTDCLKPVNVNSIEGANEPWMYPEILPEVRKAILRRYELIPYLYSLMVQSHFSAVPTQRWVGWGYESDAEVWSNKTLKDGEQQYWFGDTLLIGGIYEPDYLQAGQWVKISSPWKSSIPVLARIGGLVPVGKNRQVAAPGDSSNEADLPMDDWRGAEIFPPPEEHPNGNKTFINSWIEDDGISPPPAKVAKFVLGYAATAHEVAVSFRKDVSDFTPPWLLRGLTIILPVGDRREVVSSDDGVLVEPRRQDETGRRRFHILAEGEGVQKKL